MDMAKPDLSFIAKVKKFGHSYHVILPKEQVESLKLQEVRLELYRLERG